MPRAIVFIDGNNFYYKQKELLGKLTGKYSLLDFNYQDFCKWLVTPNDFVEARYYIGAVKRDANSTSKTKQLYANQQKLLAKLQKYQVPAILGQLIRHPDKTFHEKGVDVRIAVEMIRFAIKDQYDVAYLLSSDTDLVPAVEEVLSLGKQVHYVGIPNGQSFGLTKVCTPNVTLLRPQDIEKYLGQSLI